MWEGIKKFFKPDFFFTNTAIIFGLIIAYMIYYAIANGSEAPLLLIVFGYVSIWLTLIFAYCILRFIIRKIKKITRK